MCIYIYMHVYIYIYIYILSTVFVYSTNQIPHGRRSNTQSPDTTPSSSPFKLWIRIRP